MKKMTLKKALENLKTFDSAILHEECGIFKAPIGEAKFDKRTAKIIQDQFRIWYTSWYRPAIEYLIK